MKTEHFQRENIFGKAELEHLKEYWTGYSQSMPRGNAVVMVIPGHNNVDGEMSRMRNLLAGQGHQVFPSGINKPLRFIEETAQTCVTTLSQIYQQTNSRVHLVGLCAGGMLAREIARQFPGKVASVIGLVSEYDFQSFDLNRSGLNLQALFEPARAGLIKEFADNILTTHEPAAVPTSSIYIAPDNFIMQPPYAYADTDPAAESVLISASNARIMGIEKIDPEEKRPHHGGVAHNIQALTCVVDRLSQNPAAWQKFEPQKYGVFQIG